MKLEAIQNLIQILKTLDMKQYGAAKDLAISLCKYSNFIDLAC